MRVGVIGVGNKGETHLKALQMAGAEVVAVTDVNADRADEMAREYGVARVAKDFREVVAMDEVDAISIVTPPAAMLEIVSAACEQGKHIMCEKPLGINAAEARALLEVVTAAGVEHALCHQLRFDPSHRYIRELVGDGFIGQPLLASVEMLYSFALMDSPAWIRDPQAGGGAVIQMFSHAMDVLRFELGDWKVNFCDAVPAEGIPGLLAGDSEDIVVIAGEFPGGGRVTLNGGWVLRHPHHGMWQIYGTEGTLVMGADMRVMGGRLDEEFRDLGLPAKHLPVVGGEDFPAPDERVGPIGWFDGDHTLASLVREFEQKVAGSDAPTHYADFADGVWFHESIEAGRRAAASTRGAPPQ